jgi:hypothetical protein
MFPGKAGMRRRTPWSFARGRLSRLAVRAIPCARASNCAVPGVPEPASAVAADLPAATRRAANDRAPDRSIAPHATGTLGTGLAILRRLILLVPLATAAAQHATSAEAGMESIRQFGCTYTGWPYQGASNDNGHALRRKHAPPSGASSLRRSACAVPRTPTRLRARRAG